GTGGNMALMHRLELRQGQSLVMTPQLLQAIKLLQFSHNELVAYVEAELERNPLLERADDPDGEHPAETSEPISEPDGADDERQWFNDELAVSRDTLEAGLGTSLDNVFQDESAAKTR